MKKAFDLFLGLAVIVLFLLLASKIILPQAQITWRTLVDIQGYGVSKFLTELLKTLIFTSFILFIGMFLLKKDKKK